MTKRIFTFILVTAALGSIVAAPVSFELPRELIVKAPQNLSKELKKHKINTAGYNNTAIKILEDRIQKRMKLLDFGLVNSDAVKGMAFAEKYSPSNTMIQLTSNEKRKFFSGGKENTQILLRYVKSFKIRQETIRLFRQCKPAMPENRFHSAFFALLEFQHIYLEQELIRIRKVGR